MLRKFVIAAFMLVAGLIASDAVAQDPGGYLEGQRGTSRIYGAASGTSIGSIIERDGRQYRVVGVWRNAAPAPAPVSCGCPEPIPAPITCGGCATPVALPVPVSMPAPIVSSCNTCGTY